MVRWSARSRRARQDQVELLASNNKIGEDDTDNGKR